MRIASHWRILTVGDGDLSFSAALQRQFSPEKLTATVLDEKAVVHAKYAHNGLNELDNSLATVHCGVDIQLPETWLHVLKAEYDLVLFQFPLITSRASASGIREQGKTSNLLNRILLFDFLRMCRDRWLDPEGAGLCYITSKEVKPYIDWRIEGLADTLDGLEFVGKGSFNSQAFSGYRVRNVDRDRQVKDTAATTFVWQRDGATGETGRLEIPKRCLPGHCRLCGHGPFQHPKEQVAHEASRRHIAMAGFEQAWLQWLDNEERKPS